MARLRLPVPSYFLCSSPCLSGSLVILPSSPLNSCQTALPGVGGCYSTPAVLSWMTSADILWTYNTRSFRPRAPSPPRRSSSMSPAVAAPSCTPTGLYSCLRLASCCRCRRHAHRTGPFFFHRPVCSSAPFPLLGEVEAMCSSNLCLLALSLALAPPPKLPGG